MEYLSTTEETGEQTETIAMLFQIHYEDEHTQHSPFQKSCQKSKTMTWSHRRELANDHSIDCLLLVTTSYL